MINIDTDTDTDSDIDVEHANVIFYEFHLTEHLASSPTHGSSRSVRFRIVSSPL